MEVNIPGLLLKRWFSTMTTWYTTFNRSGIVKMKYYQKKISIFKTKQHLYLKRCPKGLSRNNCQKMWKFFLLQNTIISSISENPLPFTGKKQHIFWQRGKNAQLNNTLFSCWIFMLIRKFGFEKSLSWYFLRSFVLVSVLVITDSV